MLYSKVVVYSVFFIKTLLKQDFKQWIYQVDVIYELFIFLNVFNEKMEGEDWQEDGVSTSVIGGRE